MPKVLIIEDAEVLIKAWLKKFEDQGFQVSIANNSNSAVKLANSQHPDLIVVDLPGKEGETTVKRLREFKWANQTPVLFLNSWQDQEVYIEYQEGMDDHLSYNWSLREVVEKAKQKLALA